MIVYVSEQGARICREGQRLIVQGAKASHTLFVKELQQILIFGNVRLTPPARFLLLREGVDTVFLRADGRYMGRLDSGEGGNIFLRKRQFQLNDDEDFCLRVARDIVQAKLMNQATLMARVKREHDQPEAGQAADDLRALALEAAQADSLDRVRGVEGAGAALYFRHLPLAFHSDWGFTRRVRRPPTDPVNVVLSLLYTILISRCYAACRIAGLDPYLGCLHALEYGRHSLSLDLVEEFRAMLADAMTISLFNMRMLKTNDFQRAEPEKGNAQAPASSDEAMEAALRDPISMAEDETAQPQANSQNAEERQEQERALLLGKDAYKKVLTAFSRKMEMEFLHPHAGERMSYAKAVIYQAGQYRRLIEGGVERYMPLVLR